MHIGQKFLATFDLKDFFPSVQIDQVIASLLALHTPMLREVTSREQDGQTYVQRKDLPWTQDAAVLVAKLATYRGRVPQGAPTSPAIANLAFHAYDREILEAVGPEFVYTRYVDDLILSLSESAALRLKLTDAAQVRIYLEERLHRVLEGSGFKINARKTRVADLLAGQHVTGLRITARAIELPRNKKRSIRSLVHTIAGRGFATVACERIGGEVIANTQFRRQPLSHLRRKRRLSTERLAVLMLKKQHSGLAVEIRTRSWDSVQTRRTNAFLECQGKQRWRVIQRVLTHLWMGSVNIREEEGYLSIFEHDETELCRIRSENCLDFFLLPKREAIACVELWHEISGRVASLIVKDSNPCFDSIRSWQQLLARALDRVEIRTTQAQKEKIPPPLPMSGFVGLSSEDDLLGLAKRVYGEVSDFRSHLADESPIDSTLAQQASVFQRAVAAREHLVAWLAAADYLCIRSLSSLPTSIEGSGQSQVDVFALLPLLDDRCAARRGYRYHLEQQFLSSAVRKKDVASLDNKDYRIVQHKILGMLERRFDQSLKDRITYGAHQSQKSLTKNEGYTAISDRLKDATEEFCNLHDQCVWADHQTKVFLPDAKTELAKYSADIERCIERGTSRSIWTALFKFGKMIIDVTTESLVCGPGQPLKDQCDAFSRAIGTHQGTFETLYRLRNREAHPHRAEQWQDWAAIQNFVARTLGIVWKSKHVPAKARKLFGPNDLELTPLEGNEVKLKLLREACIGLSVLR